MREIDREREGVLEKEAKNGKENKKKGTYVRGYHRNSVTTSLCVQQ